VPARPFYAHQLHRLSQTLGNTAHPSTLLSPCRCTVPKSPLPESESRAAFTHPQTRMLRYRPHPPALNGSCAPAVQLRDAQSAELQERIDELERVRTALISGRSSTSAPITKRTNGALQTETSAFAQTWRRLPIEQEPLRLSRPPLSRRRRGVAPAVAILRRLCGGAHVHSTSVFRSAVLWSVCVVA
jgi:hypothetical protein